MCALFSTGFTSLCLLPFRQLSLTTPGACQDPSTLFLANRLAQERIKLQYVSIMDRQRNMERASEDYRRLDCLFYNLVHQEDILRREMTVLAAALYPATTAPAQRFRGSDSSQPFSRMNPAEVCQEVRRNKTQRPG